MRRIRIQKQTTVRSRRERDDVLPLDPRDPDVLRVKTASRRRAAVLRTPT